MLVLTLKGTENIEITKGDEKIVLRPQKFKSTYRIGIDVDKGYNIRRVKKTPEELEATKNGKV